MKTLISLLCVCCLSCSICAQTTQTASGEWCSLGLKLVKPSGYIGSDSYFILTVYNEVGDSVYLAPGRDGNRNIQKHSFLYSQYMTHTGSIVTKYVGTCFFINKNTPIVLKINPHSSYSVMLPLIRGEVGTTETGLLPMRGIKEYVKVRAMVKNFTAMNPHKKQIYRETLYTNWVDISHEDFSSVER